MDYVLTTTYSFFVILSLSLQFVTAAFSIVGSLCLNGVDVLIINWRHEINLP